MPRFVIALRPEEFLHLSLALLVVYGVLGFLAWLTTPAPVPPPECPPPPAGARHWTTSCPEGWVVADVLMGPMGEVCGVECRPEEVVKTM